MLVPLMSDALFDVPADAEHTTALAQAAESEHTAKVIGEWSAKVVTAMRMATAESRSYCIRCGIPHTDECRRGEQ
jgi:hypothetical protein